MSKAASIPLENLLLETLPAATQKALKARCTPMTLLKSTLLFAELTEPKYAYFITSGMLSIVAEMEDGHAVETNLVGCEGVSTFAHHLDGSHAVVSRGFMQVDGTGLRLPFKDLQKLFVEDEKVRTAILAYTKFQISSMAIVIHCNRRHSVTQRMARWLLMVADRVVSDEYVLTQTFLAEMLGTRRTSVALAEAQMRDKKIIEYKRGRIRIIDRKGLHATSCKCYNSLRTLQRNLYKTD